MCPRNSPGECVEWGAGSLWRKVSRRTFLKWGLAGAAALLAPSWWPRLRGLAAAPGPIPTRPLGRTGVPVTILGLGGEGVLRTWNRRDDAVAVIRRALEQGITYYDTAPAYSGSQDYYGEALAGYRSRIFLASKTHERTHDGSLRLLEQSLKRLRTDHLDLWQLHDLNSMDELDQIFSKRGAIHAMEQARDNGLVRFLGLTGHYDPAVLREAIRRYEFDTVLVSLNVADRHRLSFIQDLLPLANQRHLGIIGMKVLAKGELLQQRAQFTVDEALGYVLSLPVSTAIVGFDNVRQVDQAVEVTRGFSPLPTEEMTRLETRAKPYTEPLSRFKRRG